jgi:hypothetical protein
VLDEVGYLAFDNRNADLLFQVVSRRYEKKSLVLTTNQVQCSESHGGFDPHRAAGRCRRGAAGAGTLAAYEVRRTAA